MSQKSKFAPPERSSDEVIKAQATELENAVYAREMLNAMPQIAAILNENRQIIFANDSLVGYLELIDHKTTVGMRPGEAIRCIYSRSNENGCGTSENCRYCGAVNAILESQELKKKVIRECRITTLNNGQHEFLDLQVTATPFEFRDKIYTIFSVDDISDKKRRMMLERIFFHDIVNIAGAIKGFSDALKENDDPDQASNWAEIMSKLSQELIEEILSQRTLHEAETGDLKINSTETETISLLTDTLEYLSKNLYATGKKIVISPDCCKVTFLTDETLLKRVLINLLKNALEASHEGDTILINSEIVDNQLVFSVNNPTEMKEEVKRQVFQRSFSTKGQDRGIGTYSIKLLTERYLNGKVRFTSTAETGTTFYVCLPAQIKR